MTILKKLLGLVWMLLGLLLFFGLPYGAFRKLSASTAGTEDFVFWIVIAVISLPISAGFVLFGRYAWQGEYGNE